MKCVKVCCMHATCGEMLCCNSLAQQLIAPRVAASSRDSAAPGPLACRAEWSAARPASRSSPAACGSHYRREERSSEKPQTSGEVNFTVRQERVNSAVKGGDLNMWFSVVCFSPSRGEMQLCSRAGLCCRGRVSSCSAGVYITLLYLRVPAVMTHVTFSFFNIQKLLKCRNKLQNNSHTLSRNYLSKKYCCLSVLLWYFHLV